MHIWDELDDLGNNFRFKKIKFKFYLDLKKLTIKYK